MELFTFILSFVSGGISIAAIYTIYLSFRANKKIAELDIFIGHFQEDIETHPLEQKQNSFFQISKET